MTQGATLDKQTYGEWERQYPFYVEGSELILLQQ